VWRGFVALVALLLFFLLEKLVNIFGDWREDRREKKQRKAALALGEAKNSDRPNGNAKKLRVVRSGHTPSDKVSSLPSRSPS
jgi:hypothetical protein